MTCFCVRAIAFLSFDIVILCWARECITMVRCVAYIHDLCMTLTFDLNIKIIFHYEFESSKIVSALWKRHTFLTNVWPWPLTYMWVPGVSLLSFTHNFYLVSTTIIIVGSRQFVKGNNSYIKAVAGMHNLWHQCIFILHSNVLIFLL